MVFTNEKPWCIIERIEKRSQKSKEKITTYDTQTFLKNSVGRNGKHHSRLRNGKRVSFP